MVPVLTPGISWIEVSYARPYSLGCLQKAGNLLSSHTANSNLGQSPCEGSFVYVGDLSSSARSVRLSHYRPRWALLLFIADIPYILENGLSSLLHASAALAVINCLPVSVSEGFFSSYHPIVTFLHVFDYKRIALEEFGVNL